MCSERGSEEKNLIFGPSVRDLVTILAGLPWLLSAAVRGVLQ